jgi:hypothetical protein
MLSYSARQELYAEEAAALADREAREAAITAPRPSTGMPKEKVIAMLLARDAQRRVLQPRTTVLSDPELEAKITQRFARAHNRRT